MNTGKEIQKIGDLLQSVGSLVKAAGFIVEAINEGVEAYEHNIQCIRVLNIKAWTLGLTYSEKVRLKELT